MKKGRFSTLKDTFVISKGTCEKTMLKSKESIRYVFFFFFHNHSYNHTFGHLNKNRSPMISDLTFDSIGASTVMDKQKKSFECSTKNLYVKHNKRGDKEKGART